MKTQLIKTTVFATILLFPVFAAGQFAGGDGSPGDPWVIETPQQLDEVRNFLGDAFMLNADIDLSTGGFADGEGWEPIGNCDWSASTETCDGIPFTGQFLGGPFEIQNLTINRPGETELGLFGANDGMIAQVKVVDANITGDDIIGVIAGVNVNSIVNSAVINAEVSGGTNPFEEFAPEISGSAGLVGFNVQDAQISASYSTGQVSVDQGIAAGLVAFNLGDVFNSYSLVSTEITGDFFSSITASLVGFHGGSVVSVYGAGAVGPSQTSSGLIGTSAMGAPVGSAYFDEDATGVPFSNGGEAKSTVEMKQQATFDGFDFSDLWVIEEGVEVSYPYLQDNPQDPAPGLGTFFAGGDGTVGDPLQVSSPEELDAVRFYTGSEYTNLFFEQTADIDLGDILFDQFSGNLIGEGWEPIGDAGEPFMAHYDGGEFFIENLAIDSRFGTNLGLFGYVDSGTITNVGLTSVSIEGSENIGALAANNSGATISQSYAAGSVLSSGGNIGGLVGINEATIRDSYAVVSVLGEEAGSGGLVGENSGQIETSYSAGMVEGDNPEIGGLFGISTSGTVTDSYWNTDTSTQSSAGSGSGGTGLNNDSMRNEISFSGFSFASTWQIDEEGSFPYLQVNTQDPPPGFAPFAEGEGTELDPYLISTAFELAAVRAFTGSQHSDTWFEITQDIDLEDFLDDDGSLINDGEGWIPIGTESDPFTGNFNGGGFVISNLAINRPDENEIGFFGHSSGSISRVALEDADVTGQYSFGGFIGVNESGGTVSESYITGTVFGTGTPSEVGGFAGTNSGEMTNNYAIVNVEGAGNGVGGFMAVNNFGGTVTNSWSAGSVTGDGSEVEGFAPYRFGTNSNVFFDRDASGATGVGTTSGTEMRQKSHFNAFDFDTVWDIEFNGQLSYPYLRENTQDPIPGLMDNPFAGGDGSEVNPFEVATADHLDEVRNYKSEHFIQTADIDLDAGGYSSGDGWMPVGDLDNTFSGTYNGAGFEIQNLTMNRPDHSLAGFIGRNTGTLTNITMTGASVVASDSTGILVGFNDGGDISTVSVEGFVFGGVKTGGVIGHNVDATVMMLSSEGSVEADGNQTGGLIGQNLRGTINFSWSEMDVDGGGAWSGGLVGDHIAAVGPTNEAHINDSYATGDVTTAGFNAGGLVGRIGNNAFISNTYAAGNASDGGLVATNSESEPYSNVTDSYWNTSTSVDESEGGTGLTEAEMRLEASFTGFDFEDDWDILEGAEASYPFLQDFPQHPAPGILVIPFTVGDGTELNPYEVEDASMLDAVRDFRGDDAFFRQTADIDLDIPEFTTGEGWEPIGDGANPFTGEYDGGGYDITGITIDSEDRGSLFGYTEANILNLTISGASVDARGAAILAYDNEGTVTNVHVSGSVISKPSFPNRRNAGMVAQNSGQIVESSANVTVNAVDNRAGGLVGWNTGTIEDSHSSGTISNSSIISGGLVGYNQHIINDSWSDAVVEAGHFSGGFAGNNAGTITRSWALGNVTGGNQIGGFVGENSGSISFSYASGNVEGISQVGGFAGRTETDAALVTDSYTVSNVTASGNAVGGFAGLVHDDASIQRTYAAGLIDADGDYIGGFAGQDIDAGIVEDVFWDKTLSGVETSAIGDGKTTIEMMDQTTFSGFNFTTEWDINNFETYPFLQDNTQDPLPSGPATVAIEGNAGWRMLSLPVDDVAVSVLAGQNLVQGITGANAFYDGEGIPGEYEDGVAANMFYFNPAEFDSSDENPTGWVAPDNFDYEFGSGQGFLWFFYDNDVGPSVPLDDFNLSVFGAPRNTDVTVSMSVDDEWVLTGNPFTANIQATELDGTGLESAAAQIWDPAESTFVVVNFSGSETIAQWQGFFIENESATEFVIPESARTSDEADFFTPDPEDQMLMVDFTLKGEHSNSDLNTSDKAISLVFDETAMSGWDPMDVRKLTPITNVYATLAFVGERGGDSIYKAQESQPTEVAGTVEIPMKLELSGISGDFTLKWNGIVDVDENLEILLLDNETGEKTDLREVESYMFSAVSESETVNRDQRDDSTGENEQTDSPEAYRFMLIIEPGYTTSEPEPELPEEVALEQNYPNPFNPVTQIQYDLPESKEVRLDVFNIQGQRVATLVNETQNAGTHSVSFDATALASGVYLYRLQAGNEVFTRKMVFVK